MSFPALEDFAEDAAVRHHTFRVYMYLQRKVLEHFEPREIKTEWLASTLRIEKRTARAALNWLVRNGYITEHPRGIRRVRSFSLNRVKRSPDGPRVPNCPHLSG